MKRRFDAVDPIVTTVTQISGSAAIHVLLMRLAFAHDAFDVFGWKADVVFTMADATSRFRQLLQVVDGKGWRKRARPVRKLLFPFIMEAIVIIGWAMQVVLSRLAVMDAQSDDDTDAEA